MDLASIGVISSTAIGFLIPYFKKAGESTAKGIGEDLYKILKNRISKKPAAKEALDDLEKTPDDSDLQATLRVQIKKLLAEDDTFALELQRLLSEAEKTETGAINIKQTAGDNAIQVGKVDGNFTIGNKS